MREWMTSPFFNDTPNGRFAASGRAVEDGGEELVIFDRLPEHTPLREEVVLSEHLVQGTRTNPMG